MAPAFTIDRHGTLAALGQAVFGACAAVGQERRLGVKEQRAMASLEVCWRSVHGISVDEPITPGGAPWLSIPQLASARETGLSLSALPADAQHAWFELNGQLIAECSMGDLRWP